MASEGGETVITCTSSLDAIQKSFKMLPLEESSDFEPVFYKFGNDLTKAVSIVGFKVVKEFEWRMDFDPNTAKALHVNVQLGHGKKTGGRQTFAFLIPQAEFVSKFNPTQYYVDFSNKITALHDDGGVPAIIKHLKLLSAAASQDA